jgi:hypothetical protein
MPYINQKERKVYEQVLVDMLNLPAMNPGQLNYVLTIICKEYMYKNGTHYKTINDVIGVLNCVQHEMYRRVAVPYENDMMIINGDIERKESE